MAREAEVVQALVDLADTLVDDYDIVDVLTVLTERNVDLLGVSAAGVMLVSPQGELRVIASSSETMRFLEVLELQSQEGPCLDAFHTGQSTEQQRLPEGSGRWPTFSAAALQAGFRSVFAIPLRLRNKTIGALNLFNVDTAPMNERDMIVARAFADLATISILRHKVTTDAQVLNDQLSNALTSRIVIEQAKGVISERADIDLGEAFGRLRAFARGHNLLLTDVARMAIEGSLDPSAWAPLPPKP
jgi:GAF domain-containing protein